MAPDAPPAGPETATDAAWCVAWFAAAVVALTWGCRHVAQGALGSATRALAPAEGGGWAVRGLAECLLGGLAAWRGVVRLRRLAARRRAP